MSSMLAYTGFQLLMTMAIFAICLLLMMIILIQKGRGGGLASAFGGGGGGGGAFGAKTGDVFTGITVVLAGIYLLLTVCGNYVLRPEAAPLQNAAVQPASGGAADDATAPAGATGPAGTSPSGAPVQLPPGAIKLDPNQAKTSLGGAVQQGTPVEPASPPADAGVTPPAAGEAPAASPSGEAAAPPAGDTAPADAAADEVPAPTEDKSAGDQP